MNSKSVFTLLTVFVIIGLIAGTCAGGFIAGVALAPRLNREQATEPSDSTSVKVDTPKTTEELFTPFWEAWQIVHDQYVDQPVDDVALMQGAIRGMMDGLGDEHSSYMDPTQYMDAQAPLEGYTGIGAWVNTEGDYLTIVEPMRGSPAARAGLQAGDQIIAIDGEDQTGVAAEVARLKVLGPSGTVVILTILRDGVEDPFDVTVTRAEITIPSVEFEILENDIAYLALLTFSDSSVIEMRAALQDLLAENPKGLIFDLRNNSGGYLLTAIDVGSEFIEKGLISYEVYGDGSRDDYNASGDGMATDIPLVILVNEWSASASELVAGAIQDYGRAPLVGVTTFGKGSVQNWVGLSSDQGAIRVTIARWYTPEGRNISGIGLTPDYVVEISEEDFHNEIDPQLDKAIELLSGE